MILVGWVEMERWVGSVGGGSALSVFGMSSMR
jgi:hypothetical protein